MPKAPRPPDAVNEIREKILETALHLIADEGFRNLSMRKIAVRLGITATTIYNYYKNIDELYFRIRIHGFEVLHRSFEEALEESASARERLQGMIRRYVAFALENPDYYDVMFVNRTVPKYREVVGTELEEVAFAEKQTALKPLHLVVEVLKEYYRGDPGYTGDDALLEATKLWCDMNGFVSLYNSRLLQEVHADADAVVKRITEDTCAPYKE